MWEVCVGEGVVKVGEVKRGFLKEVTCKLRFEEYIEVCWLREEEESDVRNMD